MIRPKHLTHYMRIAKEVANLSHCNRRKVGALIVREDRIISDGYNGSLAGWTNCCEDSNGVTLPTTVHAEVNALGKAARDGCSCAGAAMFVTLSPCIECAKVIVVSGISTVYYSELYRNTDGIDLLRKGGVVVTPLED